MRGFKLVTNPDGSNPTVHDLYLEGGDVVEIDGVDATGQEIKTRLLFFRGEFFLDLREGVPYYQEILRKGVDLSRVKAIVKETIQSVPSVVDVPEVEISLDSSTRHATITWQARHESGKIITSEDFGSLIVGI